MKKRTASINATVVYKMSNYEYKYMKYKKKYLDLKEGGNSQNYVAQIFGRYEPFNKIAEDLKLYMNGIKKIYSTTENKIEALEIIKKRYFNRYRCDISVLESEDKIAGNKPFLYFTYMKSEIRTIGPKPRLYITIFDKITLENTKNTYMDGIKYSHESIDFGDVPIVLDTKFYNPCTNDKTLYIHVINSTIKGGMTKMLCLLSLLLKQIDPNIEKLCLEAQQISTTSTETLKNIIYPKFGFKEISYDYMTADIDDIIKNRCSNINIEYVNQILPRW